jgi:hypothetical protein
VPVNRSSSPAIHAARSSSSCMRPAYHTTGSRSTAVVLRAQSEHATLSGITPAQF